jgi:HTH-type transcriptional regulator, glycine betaine synthesis regulator
MSRTANLTSSEQKHADVRVEDVSPEFREECVEFFAEVVQVLGIPKSYGQIYGLLFATPTPLSFTDIAEQLDISRGSASQGLQALRELGAVTNVDGEGRRELFIPELRLRALVSGLLRKKVEPIVAGGSARLKSLRARANAAPTSAGRSFSDERMRKLENWRRQTGILLPLVRAVLSRGAEVTTVRMKQTISRRSAG